MGVEKDSESGQSILEFMISLPIMVGLIVILTKANTLIQMAIVNQQYGRAQALFLAYNNATYPRQAHRDSMRGTGYNQMIVGVADNPAPDPNGGGEYPPEASKLNITRKKPSGTDPAQEEPTQRALVRVRNTVSLCTQLNAVKVSGNYQPMTSDTLKRIENQGSTAFEFCRSPVTL